jgi:hypothetical protein
LGPVQVNPHGEIQEQESESNWFLKLSVEPGGACEAKIAHLAALNSHGL